VNPSTPTTSSIAEAASAAQSLTRMLPTATLLTASPADASSVPGGAAETAVVTSFVGASSADLALVLFEADALAAAASPEGAAVSIADVLRPSFEAATQAFGAGVLGTARIDDATALFADPDTAVFALDDANGPAGWIAVRVRSSGILHGGRRLGNDEIVGKLGRINNVEMSLTVEIGRTRIPVRDVLGLEPGAVIELDRSAGAPADVMLNGRLIAHGEIVVIDQDYAVRITKILDVVEGLA